MEAGMKLYYKDSGCKGWISNRVYLVQPLPGLPHVSSPCESPDGSRYP